MVELLTGTGLALSAGLNAYVPMLTLGLLARYSTLVTLPPEWEWLTDPWLLGILGVLFVVEIVADKLPAVDHLNDVLQTVIRPTSGGLVFAAGVTAVTPAIPEASASTAPTVLPVVLGVVLALVVHLVKAITRPVINLSTAGTGAPVMSVVEDITSTTLAILAILVPVFVIVFVAGLVAVGVTASRQRRRHRRRMLVPPPRRPT